MLQGFPNSAHFLQIVAVNAESWKRLRYPNNACPLSRLLQKRNTFKFTLLPLSPIMSM